MFRILERISQPGIRAMQQLRLPAKFMLISAAFLVPLGITLTAVVNYANDGINFASSERTGIVYLKTMNAALLPALVARSANQNTHDNSSNIAVLQTQMTADKDALQLTASLQNLKNTDSNQQFINELMELYATVGDNSNLILDPDLDSYYTMTMAADYGPKLLEASALLGQRLGELTATTPPSPEAIAEIRYLTARVTSIEESAQSALQRAAKANPAIATRLDGSDWHHTAQQFLVIAHAIDADSIAASPAQIASTTQAMLEQTQQMTNASLAVLDQLLATRVNGFTERRNFYLLLTLAGLLASTYLIFCFYLCNLRGFEALVTRMRKLATGNLTLNYPARGNDEIGELINAFNDSRAQLQVLVERIRQAATTISTAGSEISAANMDLAQRSSEQSAVIGETAERVKQIAQKVHENLDGTSNANHIAEEAYTVAGRGKGVVDSVVTTMDAMTGSSKRIGAIIDVINEIAFQTNLLALNAAVEAARAGEQGRGFAVVAGEVRNLAQRCATAANEITHLIKSSVHDVDKGVNQVAKAGSSMDEILDSVKTVSEIMSEMAQAGKTQAESIRAVEKAVHHIDADAQQNAAIVEETAAAADLLRQQVSILMDSVEHFTLGTNHPDVPRKSELEPYTHQPATTPAAQQASIRRRVA